MDAQEAIAILQAKVDRLQMVHDMWKESYENSVIMGCTGASKVYKKHLEDTGRELQSNSIALESAKLFHEHTVPDLIKDNVRFGRSEEYTTVYGVPLEKVGIELEKEQLVDDLRKKDKSDSHEADIHHIGETAYRFGRAEGYHEGIEAVKELFRK